MEALIKLNFLTLAFLGIILFFMGEIIGMVIKFIGLALAIIFTIVFLIMLCF
jgi:hypothetical protein